MSLENLASLIHATWNSKSLSQTVLALHVVNTLSLMKATENVYQLNAALEKSLMLMDLAPDAQTTLTQILMPEPALLMFAMSILESFKLTEPAELATNTLIQMSNKDLASHAKVTGLKIFLRKMVLARLVKPILILMSSTENVSLANLPEKIMKSS